MAAGPRAYGVAVERKLYRVARGTCYYPDCKRAIMFDVDGQPVCDVEIAHIRGAEENSARFDEKMTDAERAAFANLILLCSAHHKLVDRDEPTYPVERLEEWKADNEDDDLAALAGASLNEETLAAVLEDLAARLSPFREVRVELECGLLRPQGDLMTLPDLAGLERVVAANRELMASWPRVVATIIRSTGSAAVEVEAVDLYFKILARDGTSPGEASIMGQDDFPGRNPRLPHRMEDGSRLPWITKFVHVEAVIAAVESDGFTVSSMHSQARLATGEIVSSDPLDLNPHSPPT
jgi:hypothetical protein